MLKYRGASLIRAGTLGLVLALLSSLVGIRVDDIYQTFTAKHYWAQFAEAGGLAPGAEVSISGVNVGKVSRVEIRDGAVLVQFSIDGDVPLGDQSAAKIKTGSLLGKRMLVLQSRGDSALKPRDVIPVSRTSSPYNLTDALGDLTSNVTAVDTDVLNQSLETLSATLDQVAPQLGPTFDSLSRISQVINSRNASLRDLLRTAGDVTSILARRSDQVNTLILNANDLVEVLAERRDAMVSLLANISKVAKELSGIVADNEKELGPTLGRLNSVVAMLEKNKENITLTLPRLAKYATALGESVASGPYYMAFVGNLMPSELIQPFVDSAFGLKPRAKLPFPRKERP